VSSNLTLATTVVEANWGRIRCGAPGLPANKQTTNSVPTLKKRTAMYVEIVSSNLPPQKSLFSIQALTADELELLQNGLIELKKHSLQDHEAFKVQRDSCNDMFMKIDKELRLSRS
jgi:hypothetical protein